MRVHFIMSPQGATRESGYSGVTKTGKNSKGFLKGRRSDMDICSIIVDKESYLLELGRYIHLNPVRAGIVRRPGDYRWSSYEEYINGGRQEIITDTDDTLYCFSKKRAIVAKKYQEFVDTGINGNLLLARAVGSILGDEAFRKKVIGYLKGVSDRAEIPEIKQIIEQ